MDANKDIGQIPEELVLEVTDSQEILEAANWTYKQPAPVFQRKLFNADFRRAMKAVKVPRRDVDAYVFHMKSMAPGVAYNYAKRILKIYGGEVEE